MSYPNDPECRMCGMKCQMCQGRARTDAAEKHALKKEIERLLKKRDEWVADVDRIVNAHTSTRHKMRRLRRLLAWFGYDR